MWNIKYLKHFKWHHLTEKIGASLLGVQTPTSASSHASVLSSAYEQRVRAQKLRLQMTAAKRDAEVYVGRAEQAKAIGKMQERRAAAAAAVEGPEGSEGGAGSKRKRSGAGDARAAAEAVVLRQFRQRQPLPDRLMGTLLPPQGTGSAEGGEG